MDTLKKAVVIGGGIAGVQAASRLSGMDVTLITEEEYLPYYRMRIGEILRGSDPSSLLIHPAEWYEETGIKILRGAVSEIDTAEKNVHVSAPDSSDLRIPYDSLIIATGSRARTLSLPGGRKESHVLRTLSDALSLREALLSADSFAVIGGGLLGLELAAEAAESFHIPVSVIECADHLLPRQFDAASSEVIEKALNAKGVEVITSGNAESTDDDFIYLSGGRKVSASVLAFSAGVCPAKEIAESAGIKTGRGIIVDRHLRTSAPDVYAAGDAAELDGKTFGLAVHAREMGSTAAMSVMGCGEDYIPSEPSALLKIAGMDVASFGVPEGDARVESGGERRRTIFVKDGIVRGAVLINDKAFMASAKAMIGKRI